MIKRTNTVMPVVKEEIEEDSEYRRTTLRSTFRNEDAKNNQDDKGRSEVGHSPGLVGLDEIR